VEVKSELNDALRRFEDALRNRYSNVNAQVLIHEQTDWKLYLEWRNSKLQLAKEERHGFSVSSDIYRSARKTRLAAIDKCSELVDALEDKRLDRGKNDEEAIYKLNYLRLRLEEPEEDAVPESE